MTNSQDKNPLVSLSDTMADAVTKASAAAVLVNARRRLPATGIGYAPDLILTANHVVERDDDIQVMLPDGTEVAAQVAGRDPGRDLALLRLEKALVEVAETASDEARVGQLVLALGRPTPEGIEASLGVISAIGGPAHTRRGSFLESHMRTDAIPYPGFSGGPLIDTNGQVLGINTSGLGHGASLVIPIHLAWKTAEELSKHGSVKRGYLGIRSHLVEVPASGQEALGRKQDTGLLLVSIEEDSPASEGGLMVGDIVVGVANHPVEDHDELLIKIGGVVVGKSTPIEILRGGKAQTIDVTIGERVTTHNRRRKYQHFHAHGHRRGR